MMESTTQHTQMTIRQQTPPKSAVETVVVWNGNGARARWADKAELKQVMQSVDPDVLCFLEARQMLNIYCIFLSFVSGLSRRSFDKLTAIGL